VLSGGSPDLVLSDRIMFFRPRAQSITDGISDPEVITQVGEVGTSDGLPVVALLDGLPLQNHQWLQGRILVDDPDGWENGYEAKDRVHGTAMASLILHGELDGDSEPLKHRLYVRPVLRPDLNDTFNARRREHTPDDVLLIDLIHRAVKRICEGEGPGTAAVAPSVRVINLSIGDEARLFEREMSPWARLLDWLSFRYSVLFIVSAGNDARVLSLNTPSASLAGLTAEQRSGLAFTAMTAERTQRRLLAPAEALNLLTVGALHADQANPAALASRAAVQTCEMLEALRAEAANAPDATYDAVLLKALLVHGAAWGKWPERLLGERPEFDAIAYANTRRAAQKDFVTRWLGYGIVDVERAITCTAERATLLGCGELEAEEAFVFSAPLPPSLAGKIAWRRMTVTLAWMSPINCSHQGYRRAKLWITPPQGELRIKRENSVHDKAALRGSVQHEVLEGEDAVAFVDGNRFECKVNCAADAGDLVGKVRFALCVSLEVAVGSGISVYQEISDRIKPPVAIQPVVG
jgi:hypothetical protein